MTKQLALEGMTTREPHSVRILYTDADGRERDLRVDFTRVEGGLLRRAGGAEAFDVFTAFVDQADHLSRRSRRTSSAAA